MEGISFGDEWIICALVTDRGGGPVTRENDDFVAQRKKFCPDARNEADRESPPGRSQRPMASRKSTHRRRSGRTPREAGCRGFPGQCPGRGRRGRERRAAPVRPPSSTVSSAWKRLDLDGNPESLRKIPLGDERGREGWKIVRHFFSSMMRAASEDMVEMPMSDDEQIDFFLGKVRPRRRPAHRKGYFRRVRIEKTIGFEHSARKAFEPIHRNVVQY